MERLNTFSNNLKKNFENVKNSVKNKIDEKQKELHKEKSESEYEDEEDKEEPIPEQQQKPTDQTIKQETPDDKKPANQVLKFNIKNMSIYNNDELQRVILKYDDELKRLNF